MPKISTIALKVCGDKMRYRNRKFRSCPALTILEIIIALAIITIIFAAVLPQFRVILNGWDSRQAGTEVLQNGRVLIDHISRNLSKAVKITTVSNPTETNGYIQFLDNDSNTYRYDINSTGSYVRYGRVGYTPADLAGPVSSLKFTCYDGNNFTTTITDGNYIRLVDVNTTLPNPAALGPDKTFTASAYLRANGNVAALKTYDYSNRQQGTNIFAYSGESDTNVPGSATTPATQLTAAEYDQIEVDNGIFYVFNATTNKNYAQMRFVIQIDENKSSVVQINATWNGRGVNANSSCTDGASLYIWNYSTGAYNLLQNSGNTEAEVTLTGTITTNPGNYIGGAGQNTVTLFVVSNDGVKGGKNNEVYTDYVKVGITPIYP
jgi:type II secretory pathway pseudopilin PulG